MTRYGQEVAPGRQGVGVAWVPESCPGCGADAVKPHVWPVQPGADGVYEVLLWLCMECRKVWSDDEVEESENASPTQEGRRGQEDDEQRP